MNTITNHLLQGQYDKPITLDVYWKESGGEKPIIVFAHGFKGFKDWGHWEAIAKTFAERGYCFVKFNFSHNGVTPNDLLNFADLEAFGHNNYSKELSDLETVLDWIATGEKWASTIQWKSKDVVVIGHSRGGPISLITAKERTEVTRVITWASVHELNYAWQREPGQLEVWETAGVYHVLNGRTKQNMPLYYQLYEDYAQNEARFSIKDTLLELDKPLLIVHGDADPAVPAKAAEYLANYAQQGIVKIIPNANHVFGGHHPYEGTELSSHAQQLVELCCSFLES